MLERVTGDHRRVLLTPEEIAEEITKAYEEKSKVVKEAIGIRYSSSDKCKLCKGHQTTAHCLNICEVAM